MKTFASFQDTDELRNYILRTLCARDHLDPRQTTLIERPVPRMGKCCALFFQIRGPRLLAAYAVWTFGDERILFYDSAGQRLGETHVVGALPTATAA